MNPKKLKKENDTGFASNTPETLFSQCTRFIAENLHQVDSFCGLPDLIGEQIFKRADSMQKFDLDDSSSFHSLSLFTESYKELVAYSLDFSDQYLGVNYCQDHLTLFTELREVNLAGCKLGDDHDILGHLGQLEWLLVLGLRQNFLSDKGIQKLTSPYRVCNKGPANLHSLDISENFEITGKCYKYLNPFNKLLKVDITSTQIKGNADLLKTWKFKPVKDDGSLPVISNIGWASNVVQRWMNAAINNIKTIRVKRKLTEAQQFYSKKRRLEEINSLQEPEITAMKTVSGYRLFLVRIEDSDIVQNKNGNASNYLGQSNGCKHKNQLPNSASTNLPKDLDGISDTDLFTMYKDTTKTVKLQQTLTLKSALNSPLW